MFSLETRNETSLGGDQPVVALRLLTPVNLRRTPLRDIPLPPQHADRPPPLVYVRVEKPASHRPVRTGYLIPSVEQGRVYLW